MEISKSQVSEQTLLLNGVSVSYKLAGLGTPFLLLHGWGRGSDGYLDMITALSQAGYKVASPDLPGFGKTPPPYTAWGVDEYAQWALRFADEIWFQNFFLLGHSFGGQVASKVALIHPERVKKLILCGAAVIRKEPTAKKKVLWMIAKLGNAALSFWPFSLFQDAAGRVFYKIVGTGDWRYSQGIMKQVREKVLRQGMFSEVSGIQVPTLLVWGDQDKATPIQDAYALKREIPHAELQVISGAGHLLYREVPSKLHEIILKFLSK